MDNRKIPHPDNLIPTLQNLLNSDGYDKIAEKLDDVTCSYSLDLDPPKILTFGTPISYKTGYDLNLVVASEHLSFLDEDENKKIILLYANKILRRECLFDFVNVNVSPKLLCKPSKKKFDSDIESSNNIFRGDEKHSIPEIIIKNSKEMALVYQYVYLIENVLRSYIKDKGVLFFGEDWIGRIKIPSKLTQKIDQRIETGKKNGWMNSERESDLHFLDLMDLYNLIENNWNLFEKNFPTKEWIKSKIGEINECRNLIAHNNNSIDSHSKEVLILNSKSILRQLRYLE